VLLGQQAQADHRDAQCDGGQDRDQVSKHRSFLSVGRGWVPAGT
jgi:hypothetical protein